MASSYNSNHSEGAKAEQIITEFFAKSLHIILESRTPYMSSRNFSGEQTVSSPASSTSSSSSVRPRDKWFNLALRECPAALENFDIWRQSNLEPLVVNVVLVQRPLDSDHMNFSPKRELVRNFSGKEYQFGWNSDQEELGCEFKNEKIIERWIVQYDNRKTRESGSSSRRSSSNTLQTMYKKAILLLRSLFVTVRLLPAYKIFRELNSSGQIRKFDLVPRVPSIVEPFSRREEAEMQRFAFNPVETSCGRLCLSVLYRSSLSDVSFEHSTPMSPTFIPNYVGSPLADPLKRFPSLPVSHTSPSSLPFSRRHSWSFDQYKVSPSSVSFSPSPTHSDTQALVSNPSSRLFSRAGGLPPHPSETSAPHKKDCYVDEYYSSPHFSPSSSPSAPIHIPGFHLPKGITRAESAPVRIPADKLVNSPTFPTKQNLPPSPPLKLSRYGFVKPSRNSGPVESSATIEKLFDLGKDDSRKHSGVRLSSHSSPQISVSRSSSRSFPDDFDDPDFPCPFDVEYDDMIDPGSRPESFDKKGDISDQLESSGFFPMKKSQDAAVGALVRMLKKAPPLRQDFSASLNLSEASKPETWNDKLVQYPNQISETTSGVICSGLLASKTTADALEELRCYKEMKNLLLSQSGRSYISASNTSDFPQP